MFATPSADNRARHSRRRRLPAALGLTLTLGAAMGSLVGCQHMGSAVTPSPVESLRDIMALPAAAPASRPEVKSSASRHPASVQTHALQSHALQLQSHALQSPPDGLTLEAIESIALANNPTIAALAATTHKAAGFRTQVGLRPNPVLAYNAIQLADEGTDQHTVSVSQTMITGDKLGLNRAVLNEALRAQRMHLEAQKYRIATDIRLTFYEALAGQQRVNRIRDFQAATEAGVDIAEQRRDAKEGSQLEVVQARGQKNEIDLALRQAQVRYDAAWRSLAALAGDPDMTPVPLQGSLPRGEAALDWPSVASAVIAASPEVQAAEAQIKRARGHLCRQQVQPIPNVNWLVASGYDNATNHGMITFQVAAPIPLFNKNQGNISAARAEHLRASRELERVQDSIKARLATVSSDYDSSRFAVEQYAREILPNLKEGLKLTELAYQAGERSFGEVLQARRNYFDANLQYLGSQQQLAQARARVDGLVLSGALNATVDHSGDASLRGLTLSQQ